MPTVGPISRRDLIRALRDAGAIGPTPGRRHDTMTIGGRSFAIPNPHGGDISTGLLMRILRQAGLSREEWERL